MCSGSERKKTFQFGLQLIRLSLSSTISKIIIFQLVRKTKILFLRVLITILTKTTEISETLRATAIKFDTNMS